MMHQLGMHSGMALGYDPMRLFPGSGAAWHRLPARHRARLSQARPQAALAQQVRHSACVKMLGTVLTMDKLLAGELQAQGCGQ